MIKKRFTLRKEYFGGIVHDAKTMVCHILNETEFRVLRIISDGEQEVMLPIFDLNFVGIGDDYLEKFAKMVF